MATEISIRPEDKRDIDRVTEIIQAAFKDHSYSNQKEHLLVTELRNRGKLALSLVAEIESHLVGHIGFSRVFIDGDHVDWYGLAPVSVDPAYQNQRVGSKLITSGLAELKKRGARGCVVLGEPNYYERFGFQHHEELTMEDAPQELFLTMPFNRQLLSGTVTYHDLFTKFG